MTRLLGTTPALPHSRARRIQGRPVAIMEINSTTTEVNWNYVVAKARAAAAPRAAAALSSPCPLSPSLIPLILPPSSSPQLAEALAPWDLSTGETDNLVMVIPLEQSALWKARPAPRTRAKCLCASAPAGGGRGGAQLTRPSGGPSRLQDTGKAVERRLPQKWEIENDALVLARAPETPQKRPRPPLASVAPSPQSPHHPTLPTRPPAHTPAGPHAHRRRRLRRGVQGEV